MAANLHVYCAKTVRKKVLDLDISSGVYYLVTCLTRSPSDYCLLGEEFCDRGYRNSIWLFSAQQQKLKTMLKVVLLSLHDVRGSVGLDVTL